MMVDQNPKSPYQSCPQCGKQVPTEANAASRPFCSMRCKLIDLGGWLSERYVITSEDALSDEDTTQYDKK